jgi:hypothetical protein
LSDAAFPVKRKLGKAIREANVFSTDAMKDIPAMTIPRPAWSFFNESNQVWNCSSNPNQPPRHGTP